MTTIFYDRHFRNKALKEKYQTGNDIIIYPDNVYSQVADDIVEVSINIRWGIKPIKYAQSTIYYYGPLHH